MKDQEPQQRAVDKLDRHLYEKQADFPERKRRTLSEHEEDIKHRWNEKTTLSAPKRRSHSKVMRNIFLGSLGFLVLAVGYFYISLVGGKSSISSQNIGIEISAKTFADGGEDIDFQVIVENANTVDLELVDLIIEYPLSSQSENSEVEKIRRPLDTISARSRQSEKFDISLFGEEGEEREIFARLEYQLAGSSGIFTKETQWRVGIRSAPVSLTFNAPDRVVNKQNIILEAQVVSNSPTRIGNTMMRIEYPSGFEFISAEPEPSSGTNKWIFGDLNTGAPREIIIEGILSGETGEEKTFTTFVGEYKENDDDTFVTIFSSSSRAVSLESPFIESQITLNGDSSDRVAVRGGGAVDIEIDWQNNLPTQLSAVSMVAHLEGDIYNENSIRASRGLYDSNTRTVVWNQDTQSSLALLEPGESGELFFSFDTNSLVDSSLGSVVRSPEMMITIDIQATGIDGTIYTAEGVVAKQLALSSLATLTANTLFSSGPLPNAGSVPPRVGQNTTYTINLEVQNSSNDLTDARLSTILPTEATWINQTSPASADISYNTETREVVWDIGDIAAAAGFSGPAPEVYFQVAVMPSITNIGQDIDLTKQIIFQATDTFADVIIESTKLPLTTRLRGDTIENDGKVVN